MRCAECQYFECFMRTPLGGCQLGEKAPDAPVAINLDAFQNELALLKLARKVKALRDAQNEHAKTLNYGCRCLAIRLGKEVDEMLDKLKIE